MAILTSNLVNEAYEAIGMTGLGNSTKGNRAAVGVRELNHLIADLNSHGFISLSQQWRDTTAIGALVVFKKLDEGETAEDNVIDMEPPAKVESVARKTGNVWLPMSSIDAVQMATKNHKSLATAWNYAREYEDHDGGKREVGIVRIDGTTPYGVRVFFNARLPHYELSDTIYLSDLYDNLLLEGLKYRLACFFELSDSKKSDCWNAFSDAKKLIKRDNIVGRMLQAGRNLGGYDDSYYNGLAGNGW